MVAFLAKFGGYSNSDITKAFSISWCYLKKLLSTRPQKIPRCSNKREITSTSAGQDVVTTHVDMDKRLGDTPTMPLKGRVALESNGLAARARHASIENIFS